MRPPRVQDRQTAQATPVRQTPHETFDVSDITLGIVLDEYRLSAPRTPAKRTLLSVCFVYPISRRR